MASKDAIPSGKNGTVRSDVQRNEMDSSPMRNLKSVDEGLKAADHI